MVIFCRSKSESGWPQVWQLVSPASRVQGCKVPHACACWIVALMRSVSLGTSVLPEGRDGNGVARLIHGHRLERRVLRQRLRDRTRQAPARVRFAWGFSLGRCAHNSVPSLNTAMIGAQCQLTPKNVSCILIKGTVTACPARTLNYDRRK